MARQGGRLQYGFSSLSRRLVGDLLGRAATDKSRPDRVGGDAAQFDRGCCVTDWDNAGKANPSASDGRRSFAVNDSPLQRGGNRFGSLGMSLRLLRRHSPNRDIPLGLAALSPFKGGIARLSLTPYQTGAALLQVGRLNAKRLITMRRERDHSTHCDWRSETYKG
jgi:hypothetical protein